MKMKMKIKLNAAVRILTISEDWVKEVDDRSSGHKANDLPEGLFEKSASEIANTLKSKSKDYQQAMSRLSFYINRAGKNLSSQDSQRLEDAKSALKRAYGKPTDATAT
jgi:hypothetical protein